MGATATFHCPKCGYDTPENLYDAIGYYCEHCNEVYGLVWPISLSMPVQTWR